MNPYAIPPLIASILVSILGCFVFLINRRGKPNFFFLLEAVSIALWLCFDYILYSATSLKDALLWAKIGYVPVIFIGVFFLHFSISFLEVNKFRRFLTVNYLIGCVFLPALLLTDYFVTGVEKRFWGYYYTIGFLHTYFLVWYAVVLGSTFWILYSNSRDANRPLQERNKIKIVSFAFVCGWLAATDFIPKYGFDFYPIGFVFIIVWLGFVAYAIVKHRLFDINIVINWGTTYALTLFLGILPAAIIIYFLQKVFPLTVPIALVIVLAVALSFLFIKIHPFSEWLVQKKLFKTQTNYYQILRKFSNDMVTATELRTLLKRFDQTLREAMQVTSVAVYLTGPRNGKYPLSHPLQKRNDLFSILMDEQKQDEDNALLQTSSRMAAVPHSGIIPLWQSGDALVALAYEAKDVLVLGEMEMMARERENKRLQDAIAQMKETKAEVCMPLKRDEKMVGIALLGPREGDRYYSPDDLSLLHTLAQSTCVAIQNALMVEEIKKSYEIIERMQRLAAMGSLIAGVSHEIRNPLMPISFMMDIIADTSKDNELVMRLHKHSGESLRRIINVLDEMDELSRPHTPVFKKDDVNKIMKNAIQLVASHIRIKRQEVIDEFASLPEIMVDADRLLQAVLDILLNAIEANAVGGKIFVRTRRIALKEIGSRPLCEGVQIEVTDTGCGIPPENLEKVFNPFFTTKHKSLVREGTGLGLAIAHRIVEEHCGSIDIRSEVDKGTSVFVNLPIDR